MAQQGEQMQVSCQQCGRSFGSDQELQDHMRQEHGDDMGGGPADETSQAMGE